MNCAVHKTERIGGRFFAPGSKSFSIRAFIIAACGGRSRIVRPSNCDDALTALSAARALGSTVVKTGDAFQISALTRPLRLSHFDVNESGTVLRFLLPLAGLQEGKAVIDGRGTLRGRPNLFLTQTLRAMGLDIRGKGEKESIPIVKGPGLLHGGHFAIEGSLSSQFISALLIACPKLREDTRLSITGKELVSETYITMTRQILERSGIALRQKSRREFVIPGRQEFRGLKTFEVPSDYGLAAFFLGAAVLCPSDLVIQGNWDDRFVQADGQILPFLKRMGVSFQKTHSQIRIRGPFRLKGGTFSLKDCPDLVPIMAVLALFSEGKTRLTHIGHARVKESDRIMDLRDELLKIGARVEARESSLIIEPLPQYREKVLLDPRHDHRMAMAFSVLGLKLGVTVKDIECTAKSYPDFVKDMKRVGGMVSRV